MKKYALQLTLFECAFILASFTLFGVGLGMMALIGFDAWFTYLLALPIVGAVSKLRSAFRRPSQAGLSGSAQTASGSSA